MEAYQGYTENGRVVPLFGQVIDDGRCAIITVLDEPLMSDGRPERQKKALLTFQRNLAECLEPLPPEFDRILARRAAMIRAVDL